MKNLEPPASTLATTQFSEVVQALERHCTWPVMREILRAADIKPGTGWEELIVRAEKKDDTAHAIIQCVSQAYGENIVAGTKYIQLYDVSDDIMFQAENYFEHSKVTSSVFLQKYPLPLDETSLAAAPSDHCLCEIRKSSSGDIQLVFCSSRKTEDRLQIDKESNPSVTEEFNKAIKGKYDRYMAFSYIYQQAFDIITFRTKLKRVEVALDLPQKGLGFDGGLVAQKLLIALALIAPQFSDFSISKPLNLYPAIEGLYKSPPSSEMKINYTGFRTPSGAVNNTKMPSPIEDVREEQFFKAGAQAVKNDIRAHGIDTDWTFKHPSGAARLKLWASIRAASATEPVLDFMEVHKAVRDSDVIQTVNKVVKFL